MRHREDGLRNAEKQSHITTGKTQQKHSAAGAQRPLREEAEQTPSVLMQK